QLLDGYDVKTRTKGESAVIRRSKPPYDGDAVPSASVRYCSAHFRQRFVRFPGVLRLRLCLRAIFSTRWAYCRCGRFIGGGILPQSRPPDKPLSGATPETGNRGTTAPRQGFETA